MLAVQTSAGELPLDIRSSSGRLRQICICNLLANAKAGLYDASILIVSLSTPRFACDPRAHLLSLCLPAAWRLLFPR